MIHQAKANSTIRITVSSAVTIYNDRKREIFFMHSRIKPTKKEVRMKRETKGNEWKKMRRKRERATNNFYYSKNESLNEVVGSLEFISLLKNFIELKHFIKVRKSISIFIVLDNVDQSNFSINLPFCSK